MPRRILITVLFLSAVTLFHPIVGCGGGRRGGPLNDVDQQLNGHWAGQTLNANGERLVINFDPAGGGRDVTLELNKPGQSVRQVDTGHYYTSRDKLTMLLSNMGESTSTFTVTDQILTLNDEIFAKFAGSIDGPVIAGQILITNASRDEAVSIQSAGGALPAAEGQIIVRLKTGGIERLTVAPDPEPEALTVSTRLADRAATLVARRERLREKTQRILHQLRRRPDVASAGPNLLLKTHAIPNDDRFDEQYYLNLLKVPGAWDYEEGGNETVVAVIDTGIRLDHPDLSGGILKTADGRPIGYDFVEDNTVTGQPNPICNGVLDTDPLAARGPDEDPTDPGDFNNQVGLGSHSWHGTHIAGTIAATANNAIGIAGISTRVKVMPIRAMGRCGNGFLEAVADAIKFAVKLPNTADCEWEEFTTAEGTFRRVKEPQVCNYDTLFGPRPAARVINLSLGVLTDPAGADVLNDAINEAVLQTGVVVIASSGNNGLSSGWCTDRGFLEQRPGCAPYPAANGYVLGVGSVNPNLSRAYYSNFGNFVDFVTPGGNSTSGILSTINPTYLGGYGRLMGTSQAAGLLSGIAGMILSQNASLDRTGLYQILQNTAQHLGAGGGYNVEFGYGLVNARSAVLSARGLSIEGPPVLALSSSLMDLGTLGTSGAAPVDNDGGGGAITDLMVSAQMTNGAGWLTCALSQAATPALVQVTVDRATLDQGLYEGSCAVASSVGSASLRVKMSVGPVVLTGEQRESIRQAVTEFIARRQQEDDDDGDDDGQNNETDVGTVTLFLLDADREISAQCQDDVPWVQTDITSDYHFELRPGAGDYFLFAGVDTNEDGVVCSILCPSEDASEETETAEPCWAYPNLANPERIGIDEETQLTGFTWELF